MGQTGSWLRQMVGVFGSLEASSPPATYIYWWIGVAAVVLLALAAGRRRETAVLAILVMLFFVLPVLIEYPKARSLGLVWQGRYTLPLGVGIVLLAAAIVGSSEIPSRVTRRASAMLMIVCPFAAFLAFAEELRRYSVGTAGPIDPLHGRWQPEGGMILDLVWYGVAVALFTAVLWRISNPGMGSRLEPM